MIRSGLLALVVALGAMALGIQTVPADDELAGVWKLQSWAMQDVETKVTKAVFGEKPNGYLILTSEGRMMGLLPAQARKGKQTHAERVAGYGSMLAYSGLYRVEGDNLVTKVDVSWNEGWVGTEQSRFYKIEGTKLQVLGPPRPYAGFGDHTVQEIFTFERHVK